MEAVDELDNQNGLDHEFVETAANETSAIVEQNYEECQLIPDFMGLYTISLCVPSSDDCVRTLSSLEEDIAWFDTPVSALLIENNEDGRGVKPGNIFFQR